MDNINIVKLEGMTGDPEEPASRYIPGSLIKRKGVDVLGALEPEGRLVGALAYGVEDGIVRIFFICVDEFFRREGVGTALLKTLLELAGNDEEMYPVEACYPKDEEREALTAFFRSTGCFMIYDDPRFYRTGTTKYKKLPIYKKLVGFKGKADKFYSVPSSVRNGFLNKMDRKGIFDLLSLPGEKEAEKELCFCTRRSGEITAAVFVKVYEDEAEISYMYAESGRDLLDPLSAAIKGIEKKYPKKEIVFSNLHRGSYILTEGIFGDGIGTEEACIAVWNGIIPE